jgi:MoaA/NifB/PqqE/SkfB family radical SAM enzyme
VPTSLIRSVDLRLGNLCNLKCRMCSPVSSRLLIPEWRTLFNVAADDPRLAALESVDWFSADTLWENCAALAPQVQTLHFAGGEPLLITRMLDFLSRLVEHGSAPGITLSYVTNLTTLPERVVTLWPRFAAVSITVSLDGAGPLNTYIRFPSKWENIDAHLTALVRDPGRFNCAALTINTTVQAYNVLRLDALCEYVICHVAPHVTSYPRLTLLQWPSCMSVQVLPPELKMLATSRLRAFVRRWATRWPVQGEPLDRFLASIEGVIAHMHARDGQHEFAEFVRRTLVFDRERHQDIRVILPELAAAVDAVAGP